MGLVGDDDADDDGVLLIFFVDGDVPGTVPPLFCSKLTLANRSASLFCSNFNKRSRNFPSSSRTETPPLLLFILSKRASASSMILASALFSEDNFCVVAVAGFRSNSSIAVILLVAELWLSDCIDGNPGVAGDGDSLL